MEFEDLSPDFQQLIVDNHFEYIRTKAKKYLEEGPDKYRLHDAFDQPDEDYDKIELMDIEKGCKQILEYKGLTIETAFEGLGIKVMYQLLHLFHFKSISQRATSVDNAFIDKIIFRHVITEDKVTLFNKVKNEKR